MEEDEIREYLKYYEDTQGVLPAKIREFGEKFREQGYITQEQLYQVAYESSTRSAYHVRKNPEEVCRKVTEHVMNMRDDFSQISLVSSLKGFKAPTASCVLTAKDPERHAIVDTRVWASLERYDRVEGRKESFDQFDYMEMIEEIRDIASGTEFSTAEVGYALFAHDVKHREGTLH